MEYLTMHQSINTAGYYTLLSLPFIVAVLKTCGRVFPHVGAQIPSASPNVPNSHSSFGWQDQALFLESFQLVHGIVQEDHLQLQILRYAVHKGGRVSLNEEGFFFSLHRLLPFVARVNYIHHLPPASILHLCFNCAS
jgi:hypothetical protein